ncbi:MAG: Gfo/Idh/MocA family oxidoreductase [Clostridia bacterium]|nr:Gfo/Idh/MocA family oxidoreductase [Clostridia bacterium]
MLRVCVIGMGHIGFIHARSYVSSPEAELVGVCDIRRDRAEDAAKTFGVPCFLDAQEMLDQLKPDLVSVTTGGYEYSSDHYIPTMQALEAGCHVLGEKPISNNLRHAAEMVETAKKMNVCYGIDFNHRFTPPARQAEKWMADGRIGDLLFCNMALWIGKFMPLDSVYYHLKALNPHSVNIMQHFMGLVDEVSCFAMKAPGRDIWSTASVNMKFECGAVGHLTSSYDIKRGHPMERCEVAGTKGRFVFEDMWREATLYPAETMVKEVYTNPVFDGYADFEDTFKCRIHTFVKQVDSGCKPEDIDGSGLEGYQAQRVIHAAIKSLDNGGEVVKVSEVFD